MILLDGRGAVVVAGAGDGVGDGNAEGEGDGDEMTAGEAVPGTHCQ